MSGHDFKYDGAKVQLEALHWVRRRIGDVKIDRSHLTDSEIESFLIAESLTKTSVPAENWNAIHTAAADCAETIAAALIRESELVFVDGGVTKSTAASGYFKLADRLRSKVTKGGAQAQALFANPTGYPTTHVAGVDPSPELEA